MFDMNSRLHGSDVTVQIIVCTVWYAADR